MRQYRGIGMYEQMILENTLPVGKDDTPLQPVDIIQKGDTTIVSPSDIVEPYVKPIAPVQTTVTPIDKPDIETVVSPVTTTATTTDNGVPKDNLQIFVTGTVFSNDKGLKIPVTISIVDMATNQRLQDSGEPTFQQDGLYSAWTVHDPNNTGVKFESKGYQTQTWSFTDLLKDPDVFLTPGEDFPYWMIALVIIAVIAYRKKSGKIGKLSTSDVLPIMILAGGLIGFSVIQKILVTLGLWKSQDTKELDQTTTDPGSFWTTTYWQTVLPPGKSYNYPLTEEQAYEKVAKIYNSFGMINDDEDTVIGIFKTLRTKANASFLSWVFTKYFGQDFLTWLRGGLWPEDRLSDADVNVINKYIEQLPNY